MRVTYFILSHTNVAQVIRLAKTIARESPECRVVIHHDASRVVFDPDAFAAEPRIRILERSIRGEWATFSLVEIALEGIRDLDARDERFDFLALLSGQDYPVRPLAEFEAELARSGDGMLPNDPVPGQLLDRYTFRWVRLPQLLQLGPIHRLLGLLTRLNAKQPALRFLSGRVGARIAFAMRRSPLPAGMHFAKGSQWWALSARAIDRVGEFVRTNPDAVRHFRDHTIMPDESFFQTILLGAPGFVFAGGELQFTKWAGAGASSPDVLVGADFPEIVASGKFFARKFDTRVDGRILDSLDERRVAT